VRALGEFPGATVCPVQRVSVCRTDETMRRKQRGESVEQGPEKDGKVEPRANEDPLEATGMPAAPAARSHQILWRLDGRYLRHIPDLDLQDRHTTERWHSPGRCCNT
jgi:hypothetical protein